MKNKIIIGIIITLVVSIGSLIITKDISKEEIKEYKTSNYLNKTNLDIKEINYHAYFEQEYTPEYLLNASDAIVLASIISIDGADNKYDVACGSTYGKMVINNVLWGTEVNEKEVIEYVKSGGIISVKDYEENQVESAKEKIKEIWSNNKTDVNNKYLNLKFPNEPDIEEGKIYLCYLKYNEELNKYAIIGLDKGFRELNINKTNKVTNKSLNYLDYKILNNTTKKYESLKDYYLTNIKKYDKQ